MWALTSRWKSASAGAKKGEAWVVRTQRGKCCGQCAASWKSPKAIMVEGWSSKIGRIWPLLFVEPHLSHRVIMDSSPAFTLGEHYLIQNVEYGTYQCVIVHSGKLNPCSTERFISRMCRLISSWDYWKIISRWLVMRRESRGSWPVLEALDTRKVQLCD